MSVTVSWYCCPAIKSPSLDLKRVGSVDGGTIEVKVDVRLSITDLVLTSSRVEMVTNRMKNARTNRNSDRNSAGVLDPRAVSGIGGRKSRSAIPGF